MYIPIWILVYSASGAFAASAMAKKFNHDMHDEKVFHPQQIKCNYCHNIELNSAGKFKANSNLDKATFQKPLKAICHECHKVEDKQFDPAKSGEAPKSCYTCHDSFEQISVIRPQSHQTKFWKSSHGLKARTESTSCMNCHSNSQCSTCHTQRNDVNQKNHLRNYRFFHSIEARMSPQRCDACHSKTYCTQCHLGKKAL
jgi:hypothetical protein